jgi:ABC-type transport system substrate-binding protein
MMKRFLALMLALCMMMSLLAACGGSSSDAEETAANAVQETQGSIELEDALIEKSGVSDTAVAEEYVIGLPGDPADFQPYSSASSGRMYTMPMLYEYLAVSDSTGPDGFVGVIMKDYEQVDELTYRITIYDNVYDTNGNHITAEDVVWCYDTCKEIGKTSKIKKMDVMTTVDDYVVEMKLNSNAVGALLNLMVGTVPIVSKASYEASPDGMILTPVGTTGYVLTSYESGSSYTFEHNGNYWQSEELTYASSVANAKKIVYRVYPEAAQLAIALETGEIDAAYGLSTTEAARFMDGGASSEGYTAYSFLDSSIYCLLFNGTEGGLMDNQALRQAICYAIDAQGLVDGVYNGKAIVTKAFGSPLCVDYVPDWDNEEYYDYNAEKAKELLAESGVDLANTTVRIMTPNYDVNKKMIQIVQAYLSAVGIQTELLIYESSLFGTYKTDPTQWDIMLDSRMSNDVVVSLASFILAQSSGTDGANLIFVKDDVLEQHCQTVLSMEGHTVENLKAYQEYVKETAYVYSMTCAQSFVVTKDSVTSLYMDGRGSLYANAATFTDAINE